MRIVIATTSGFHLRHLARELIILGHEVRYLTYLPEFRIERDGIPKDRARSYFMRLQPWSTGALCRYTPSVQRRCVEKMLDLTDRVIADDLPPCDIFIGLSAMAVRSAEFAKKRYGAKVIIDRGSRHVVSQQQLVSSNGGNALTNIYVQRELASYEVADYIALPSLHAVDSFVQQGFTKNRLIYNPYGVDLELFKPEPCKTPGSNLLFIGAWSYRKGADILGAALDRLPEFSLTHVGTRTDVDFPINERFKTLGHKSHHELREIFAKHRILILPSREDGFGLVLLEALASGLGVVASEMTGGPDVKAVIKNNQYVRVIEPGSVDHLVNCIREMADAIADQPADRNILSSYDEDYFSWQAYAKRYSEFLSSIS